MAQTWTAMQQDIDGVIKMMNQLKVGVSAAKVVADTMNAN